MSASVTRPRAALSVAVGVFLALGCGGAGDPDAATGGAPVTRPAADPAESAEAARPATAAARGADAPPILDDEAEVEMQSLSTATFRPAPASACGLPELAADGDALVYFGCTPESGPVVRAVAARRIAGNDAEAALEALLAGPTEAERARGFLSSFGPQTAGIGFRLGTQGGVAWVDFDAAILDVEGLFVAPMDTAQIVATLGQFEGIERVLVLVGGQPLCRARGDC